MGFTVIHPGGTTDAEFLAYNRLLRQSRVDLGKSPRVPDPGTGRRWLLVWNTPAEAQAFAEELRERTGDNAWEVSEVNGPASEGPLGPIVIQLLRQAEGLTFVLPPLSRALLRSAFPEAVSSTTDATLDTATWNEFRNKRGDLGTLVRLIAPNLTGLTSEQLADLGYAVIDTDSEKTYVFVPPALLSQV